MKEKDQGQHPREALYPILCQAELQLADSTLQGSALYLHH